MNAKSHPETLFEKYSKRIIEYESLRMITKAEIRRAEMAGDEHEAEKQRIEMERFDELHGLCVGVVEDLEQLAKDLAI
ncbi:MAG: hypothetical protein PVH87_24115 [Desulfobacteraceae bacterium]|jgi:hypothetical protein